jgi:hypothetical protein
MSSMSNDQPGEELDEALPGDFPPDEPSAVEDIGTTGVEQLGGESFDDRDRRTLPDFGEPGAREAEADGEWQRTEVEAGALPTDGDVGDVLLPVDETRVAGEGGDIDVEAPGALSDEDQVTGDETARDVATERVTPPAEEAAIHIERG